MYFDRHALLYPTESAVAAAAARTSVQRVRRTAVTDVIGTGAAVVASRPPRCAAADCRDVDDVLRGRRGQPSADARAARWRRRRGTDGVLVGQIDHRCRAPVTLMTVLTVTIVVGGCRRIMLFACRTMRTGSTGRGRCWMRLLLGSYRVLLIDFCTGTKVT